MSSAAHIRAGEKILTEVDGMENMVWRRDAIQLAQAHFMAARAIQAEVTAQADADHGALLDEIRSAVKAGDTTKMTELLIQAATDAQARA